MRTNKDTINNFTSGFEKETILPKYAGCEYNDIIGVDITGVDYPEAKLKRICMIK